MLKNFAFGILAAALTIAPGAAFAGSQSNSQVTEQNGAAVNGSTNAQTSTSVNVQNQIQKAQQAAGRFNRYKPNYGGSKNCTAPQSQRSGQVTRQSGAATDGSVNAQDSTTTSNQRQTLASRCR